MYHTRYIDSGVAQEHFAREDGGRSVSARRRRSALLTAPFPSLPDRRGELRQHGQRRVPTDAGVGDALTVAQRGRVLQILTSLLQVALDHDAEDGGAAARDLSSDVAGDLRLALVVLAAVTVTAVDEGAGAQARLVEELRGLADARRVVVRPGRAA